MKRRELIRKSILAATGLSLGNRVFGVKSPSTLYGKFSSSATEATINPIVIAEEVVYQYQPTDNGAGPMWCSGSTCLVRIGDRVFASGIETIAGQIPLNNCRWMLFERNKDGWKQQVKDDKRTREPSPLAAFYNGQLVLSANPTLTGPNEKAGAARPEILLFKSSEVRNSYEQLQPVWTNNPKFTEHSYRSLATDGARGELILFQEIGNVKTASAVWTFRDAAGNWSAQGGLEWPSGAEYEDPIPIRTCYPNVMLKDRAVYFCGVSDIVEPKKAWREYKKQITGRDWDYDFRRLFFTWSDNITTGKFHPWIEIASREATCGWINPCDLWVAPDGKVHILWNERAIDERLREKFFPDARQSQALNYAILKDGKIITRQTLALSEEGGSKEVPGAARFQIAPDNRLFVVYFIKGSDSAGNSVAENRILELSPEGLPGLPVKLPLKRPFSSFFTATVRAGSKPSSTLDLLGPLNEVRNAIHYAQIRLW